jgi:ubiquitin-activating enzyme E1
LAKTKIKIAEWAPPKKAVNLFEDKPKEAGGAQEAAPAAASSSSSAEEEEAKALREMLAEVAGLAEKAKGNKVRLSAADFEKDDDSNFHIDFVTACSNMRAWNYHIKEASRHQCKMIAGRIIPAIATTTAMITGLVCLEIYKLAMGLPKDKFYSSNVNLATGTFELFEPDNPIKAKPVYDIMEMADVVPVPMGFTIWDKVIVDKGPLTVKQFLDVLPTVHHGCTCSFLIKGNLPPEEVKKSKPIYCQFCPTPGIKALVAENIAKPLHVVYQELYGPLPQGRKYLLLEGSFSLPSGDPAKIPPIKYIFSQ